jgi:hypothetical protein
MINYEQIKVRVSNHVALREIEGQIKEQVIGQDYIGVQEAYIVALGLELDLKKQEVDKLIELIKTDYVPIVTKEKIDAASKATEVF